MRDAEVHGRYRQAEPQATITASTPCCTSAASERTWPACPQLGFLAGIGQTAGERWSLAATVYCLQYATRTNGCCPPSTITGSVADAVREMVVDGRLPPGGGVNEVHLAAALGISRTPLREALMKLTAEGALVSVPDRLPSLAPVARGARADLLHPRILAHTDGHPCSAGVE
jgi:hypothetical protein